MGWEIRKRGSRYYTRSYRANGQVRRQYLGSGAVGEAFAVLDVKARADREAEEGRRRAEREELKKLDDLMSELEEATDTLMKAHLLAAGYHRHKQGEWRKRRAKDG